MIKKFSFSGGVHPPESKLTAQKAIEVLSLPEQVIIPLTQHIGAPANPLVKIGDMVKTGQKIGEAGGFVSANIHSSVTGKIVAIAPFPHPLGKDINSIVIETAENEEWVEGLNVPTSWDSKTPKELKDDIIRAGIVGMGGAAFPTAVKLSPPEGKKIDTLIINGAECEPYLTADHRLMLELTDDIIIGVEILARILGVKNTYITVENNKMDAYKAVKKSIENKLGITLCLVKTKYPQGGEKQLINAVTGREVPTGGLPMDCGCVVQNIGTTFAVMEAVTKNKPLIERVLTITGAGISTPKNLKVRIGTPFKYIIETCDGLKENCTKLISGGPMMGATQYSINVPVVKATSGILCLTDIDTRDYEEKPCISCGACMRACPVNLIPSWIAKNVELERWDKVQNLDVMDCMECGSCSYGCPSKINIVHYIKWAKLELLKTQKKN